MKDSLGDRMKEYEANASLSLCKYWPIIARIDGRAFHSFTKGLKRPYDKGLSDLMVATTKYLVEESNAVLGYTQSDEISLMFYTDNPDVTQLFFDAKHSKMVSILASMTTAFFNMQLYNYLPDKALGFSLVPKRWATFDTRVFNVPNKEEAINYFLWRELDATKNSISMAAQSMYSHYELQGKNSSDKQEMMWQKGVNWNDYPDFFKKGTYLKRVKVRKPFSVLELANLPEKHSARYNPNLEYDRSEVQELIIPPLTKVVDKEKVLFGYS
jgi:tRNA(His) guanylyltransferase